MNRISITVIDVCIVLCGLWFGIQSALNSSPFGFAVALFFLFFLSGRLLNNQQRKIRESLFSFFLLFFGIIYMIDADTFLEQLTSIFYTNSSVSGLQLAVFSLLLYWFLQKSAKPSYYFFLTLLITSVVLVLSTSSRGAIIALLAGSLFLNPKWKQISHKFKVRPIFTSILFIVIIAVLFAVTFKSDSTSGRSYIVENSLTLFSKNLVTGVGVGGFNPAYNHTQADYFSTHSLTDKRALLANDGYYAFNELLHIGVEQGVIGLLILVFLAIIMCREIYRINKQYEKKKLEIAILLSIVVNSMVSYPLHNLSVFCVFALCLGSLSRLAKPIMKSGFSPILTKPLLFLCLGAAVYAGYKKHKNESIIKEAISLKKDGYKMDALNLLSGNQYALISNVNFGIPYLELLYETGHEVRAINDFDKMHKYHCNQKMHKLIAKCYRETNDFKKAENHFLLSLHITPQLLQSRLDLANFYKVIGNDSLSTYWAEETISCPVKIYSSRVENIRESARKLLK